MEDEREHLWKCACGQEAVGVTYSDWSGEREIYLSFWRIGTGKYRYSILDKIYAILGIIRDGHCNLDQIVLTPDQAKRLGLHLLFLGGKASEIKDGLRK